MTDFYGIIEVHVFKMTIVLLFIDLSLVKHVSDRTRASGKRFQEK